MYTHMSLFQFITPNIVEKKNIPDDRALENNKSIKKLFKLHPE